MGAEASEPRPRAQALQYTPFAWPEGNVTYLEATAALPVRDLASLLYQRRTRRDLGVLSLAQASNLLGATCQTKAARPSPFGFPQELRAHPSAGAVHPIHVLCQLDASSPWARYDPVLHALVNVPGSEMLAATARGCAADFLGDCQRASLLALVAEPGKTQSKYEDADSLIWRDAGVVLGYLSIAAEALGLNLCPLGTTGNAFVSPIAPAGLLQGCGMLLVGSRPAAPSLDGRTAASSKPRR